MPTESAADAYTTAHRLCNDVGLVEGAYLGILNRLRALSGYEPYSGPPFVCTGSAHLAGERIRCTSPAHDIQARSYPSADVPAGFLAPLIEGTNPPLVVRMARGDTRMPRIDLVVLRGARVDVICGTPTEGATLANHFGAPVATADVTPVVYVLVPANSMAIDVKLPGWLGLR